MNAMASQRCAGEDAVTVALEVCCDSELNRPLRLPVQASASGGCWQSGTGSFKLLLPLPGVGSPVAVAVAACGAHWHSQVELDTVTSACHD